ncbi:MULTISPECIES: type II toxin-antitoxin system RelB/DinJ family antitoxin [unclassified Veillonella]|jgi:addiction module antitoxin, relB/dinJ family|uniref:type II toxin-antitoxin system RelB/DinJ family antitoxin n=1 Tax=unclassified Veillonella TaxID=2630086 RepID=UPI00021A2A55|nr:MULTISPECIES: type II toxin-antitoxin system RelB/DinJ family antitoxin [unclassified Veillonella]EGS33209.1 addiction module antitoxin, RelB/DinJ family [Veillonella sp. oral taxon 780 str. F0422]
MKSASVNVRINENIKQHAESILEDLGLSRAVAIDLFYRQIILHNGLPFDLKLNTPPLSTSDFSPSELEDILSRGVEESNNGNGRSAKEFFATLLGE